MNLFIFPYLKEQIFVLNIPFFKIKQTLRRLKQLHVFLDASKLYEGVVLGAWVYVSIGHLNIHWIQIRIKFEIFGLISSYLFG